MVSIFRLFIASVIASSVVAGCASAPKREPHRASYRSDGSVNAEIVAAPEGAQYEISPGVAYISPESAPANKMPDYPSHLLIKQLDPVEIITRIVVNEAGLVESASVIQGSVSGPEFSDATLTAVKSWSFSPLKRVEGLNAEAIPFSQEYRITFRQLNGHAIVESSARH